MSEKVLRALVLTTSVPNLRVSVGRSFSCCPPNLSWEWNEAVALGSAGVEIMVGPVRHVIPQDHTDVVFASSQNLAIAAQHAADELGVPWVCRVIVPPAPQDGPAQNEQDEALVALLDTAAAVVFPSDWLCDAWASRLVGVRAGRRVVPHGIAAPQEVQDRRSGALFIGWLTERKRVDVAIRACHKAGIVLTVVGDGPERRALVRLAAELDADVRFTGIVDEDAKAIHLGRNAFYVSAAEEEYFGIPVGEALAAGCRVLPRRLPALLSVWSGSGVEWWDTAEALVVLLRMRRTAVSGAGASWLAAHGYDLPAVGRRLAEVLRDVVT